MKHIKLSEVAEYATSRVKVAKLTPENYVGTDNILQNKQGKKKSEYLPDKGSITEYVKGDILIANIRPYLKKIWYATNSGGSSPDVLTIRTTNTNYDSKFIYYNLLQDMFFNYAMSGAKGARMPRGDKNQIMDFPISDFKLSTQVAISKILYSIDAKIEINRKINNELEHLARTIYDYWFIGFNFPNRNNLPYRFNGGTMIYSDKLKREIPLNWKVKKLSDLFTSKNDNTEKIEGSKILSEGKYPVITQDVDSIIKGYTNLENPIKELPVLVFGDHSTSLKYVNFPFFRGADGTQLLYFESDELLLLSYFWINKIIPTIPNYGKYERHFKYLKDYYIVIPDNRTLGLFSKQVQPLFNKIQKNNQESDELRKLRDWLLPMLMNGQISVNKGHK